MTLGSTQPLTEMSSSGRCVGLTTLQLSHADCLEIREVATLCSRKGISRPVMGYFHLPLPHVIYNTRKHIQMAVLRWMAMKLGSV